MKICVSSMGEKMDSNMDNRFGRCLYFNIYDTETKEMTSVKNKGNDAFEGAGIAASQQVIDSNVDVLITGKLGPNAFRILESSNMELISCMDEVTIESAIKLYGESKLSRIQVAGRAHQGMNKGR